MALERTKSADRIRELKEKRKRRVRVRFLIGLTSILIIVGSAIFISRTHQLQIQNVVVRGNYIVSADEVKNTVNARLAEKWLWVIPKSNVLLYPEKQLSAEIAERFPRFDSVRLHRENWGTLVLDVTERKNVYLWCDKLPAEAKGTLANCYYVDDHGYIFSRSPSFSGTVYFVFYGNYGWTEGESPIGKTIFTDEYFKNLIRFKEGLPAHGLTSYGFVTYSTGVSSFLLSPVMSDAKQKIVFTASQDLPTLFDNLILALSSESLQKQLRDEFNSLQYLDLRYDKKVYYKFGSAPDITEQETVPLENEQQPAAN